MAPTIESMIEDTPRTEFVATQKTLSFRILALITGLNFIILIIIVLFFRNSYETIKKPLTISNKHFIVRDEWQAQPPVNELLNLELPVDRVFIGHTATEFCYSEAHCTFVVRVIQTLQIRSDKRDILWNFLVGGDGAIYEGCGWNKQGYNNGSIGIGFLGTFTYVSPMQRPFDALKILLEEGVRLEKLTKSYKLYPQRALFGDDKTAEQITEVIKYWPHYMLDQ